MDGTGESAGAWVERRLAWLERAKTLKPRAVDVDVASAELGGSGPLNRHGEPSTPPGQHLVKNWPVLDLGHHPVISPDEWVLEISGEVERPQTLSFEELLALPQTSLTSDFHCVTTWSRLDLSWVGVLFSDLCELVIPKPSARFVATQGSDREPGSQLPYTTNISLGDAMAPDVMIAHRCDGAPLSTEHGGPVRMVTPRLYAWKGAKWIERIEFLAEDRPGYWEERGYSNTAQPWAEDRFSTTGAGDA